MDINIKSQAKENTGKLSFGTKLSYGMGDFASNLSWGLVASYLNFYYSDVFGLPTVLIGVLLLVARVWDCFVDPIVGLVIERTNTRFGRFRPYILFGAIVFAIFNTLTFTTPSFGGTAKIVYAFITYIILGTVYSVVNVPYGALATVMTRDTEERTSINSFRGVLSSAAGIVTGALVMPLIQLFGHGNNQRGYALTALTLSLITLPMFFMVFKNCKEVITPAKHEKPKVRDSLKSVVANKPLLLISTSLFFAFSALFGRIGMVIYYYLYNMQRPDLIAIFMTSISISCVFGAFIVNFIAKKIEKRTVLIIGNSISAIALVLMYIFPATNVPLQLVLTFVANVPIGFLTPIVFSTVADCVDYGNLKTGTRADGAIYSFVSLVMKISTAVIGSVCMVALSFIGYVANQAQSVETINGLNFMVNIAPAILFILATIPMYFYTLSKKEASRISDELVARNNGIA